MGDGGRPAIVLVSHVVMAIDGEVVEPVRRKDHNGDCNMEKAQHNGGAVHVGDHKDDVDVDDHCEKECNPAPGKL